MKENLQTAIQRAIDEAPERGFVESIEISFTIKDVDLKVPTNRIQEEVRLPSGRESQRKSLCLPVARWRKGEGWGSRSNRSHHHRGLRWKSSEG